MRTVSSDPDPRSDLFKIRLKGLVNPDHSPCRLAQVMDWGKLEREIKP